MSVLPGESFPGRLTRHAQGLSDDSPGGSEVARFADVLRKDVLGLLACFRYARQAGENGVESSLGLPGGDALYRL